MTACAFEGCERTNGVMRRGLCWGHYNQKRMGRALAPLQYRGGQRMWTKAEDALLTECYADGAMPLKDIAYRLGRRWAQVECRVKTLGLSRPRIQRTRGQARLVGTERCACGLLLPCEGCPKSADYATRRANGGTATLAIRSKMA